MRHLRDILITRNRCSLKVNLNKMELILRPQGNVIDWITQKLQRALLQEWGVDMFFLCLFFPLCSLHPKLPIFQIICYLLHLSLSPDQFLCSFTHLYKVHHESLKRWPKCPLQPCWWNLAVQFPQINGWVSVVPVHTPCKEPFVSLAMAKCLH